MARPHRRGVEGACAQGSARKGQGGAAVGGWGLGTARSRTVEMRMGTRWGRARCGSQPGGAVPDLGLCLGAAAVPDLGLRLGAAAASQSSSCQLCRGLKDTRQPRCGVTARRTCEPGEGPGRAAACLPPFQSQTPAPHPHIYPPVRRAVRLSSPQPSPLSLPRILSPLGSLWLQGAQRATGMEGAGPP